MQIADITAPHDYHYRRKLRGVTTTGKAEVQRVFHVERRGWYILAHDKRRNVVITLRPGHFVRRVKVA